MCKICWNENRQNKPKYIEKTFPGATLTISIPIPDFIALIK
jgi:hypothetical protein